MILKRNKLLKFIFSGKLFFIFIFSLTIGSPSLLHSQITPKNKHVIIAYDFSGSVLKQRAETERANRYLLQFVCTGSIRDYNLSSDRDYLTNNIQSYGFDEPIYQTGDVLTFLSFGIGEYKIYSINLTSSSNSEFIETLSKNLIKSHGTYHENNYESIQGFLKEKLPTLYTPRSNYTLSRYIIPLSLNVIPEFHAIHTILIVISDFKYGDDVANIGDRNVIHRFAPEYLDAMDEVDKEFRKFYSTSNLLTLNIGGEKGIVIKTVEIFPRQSINIFLDETKQISLKENKDGTLELPKLNLIVENFTTPVDIGNKAVHVEFPKAKLIMQIPIQIIKGNLTQGLLETDKVIIPSADIPQEDETALIKLQLEGTYNSNSGWGSPLYYLIESDDIVVPIQKLSVGIPQFLKVTGFFIFLSLLGITSYLYLSSPVLKYEIRGNTPKVVTEENIECDAFDWDKNKICKIDFKISNVSNKYNPKKLKANIWFESVILPQNFDSLIVAFLYKNKKYSQGEIIKLTNLDFGATETITIAIDLTKTKEPEETASVEPIIVKYSIISNTKEKNIADEYRFVVVPHIGEFWLGIDPGTSGSSVAGGNQPDSVESVILERNETVVPSTVFIDDKVDKIVFQNQYGNGVFCGKRAHLRIAQNPERIFTSAKKLIGYLNVKKIEVNGKEREFKGTDAVSILSSYLIKQTTDYFQNKSNYYKKKKIRINKAIVAVPNSFTPSKIKLMEKCVLNVNKIKEVYHIYEAEATVMYYLANYNQLNKNRHSEAFLEDLSEYILVCDFGGGTLNVSIIAVSEGEEKTKINVLCRIGYGIGGDNIDRVIAELIWDKTPQDTPEKMKDLPPPFELVKKIEENKNLTNSQRGEWWNMSYNFKTEAENLKIDLSKQYKKMGIKNTAKTTKNVSISLEEIINHQNFGIFKIAEEAVREVYEQFKNISPGAKIHTALFAGRTFLFPMIKERVLKIIEQDPMPFVPEIKKVKECVSIGAAYYGIHKKNIELTRPMTFANYGLILYESIDKSSVSFENIIPINREFEDGLVSGQVMDLDVRFNGNIFMFYQVMDNNPNDVFRENIKYKCSMIKEIELDTKKVKEINLQLTDNDNFEVEIVTDEVRIKDEDVFEVKDILEDMEESSTWLLA